MPQLIRSMVEIIRERKADTLFVKFKKKGPSPFLLGPDENADIKRMLDWLEINSINYEMASPPGHFEGYTGLYAIYFSTMSGELYELFLDTFETKEGVSKTPESYFLIIEQYRNRHPKAKAKTPKKNK